MSPRIVRHQAADDDLFKSARFIAKNSRQAAHRFLEAAERAFKQLLDMPEIGSPCEFNAPAAAGLRMWPIHGFEKHIIFYGTNPTGIEVVRVLHAARDLEALFGG
jgi:toxin ParE1/3/4